MQELVRKYAVHYIFRHKSTSTKLSQDVTQYYKNIVSPIGAKVRIGNTIMNSTTCAHELQKENSRVEHGAWKKRTPNGLLLIHYATIAQF